MRLAFLGSPPAAVPTLTALVAAGHEITVVVSAPDRRRGRGSALVPTAVKDAALELGLPISTAVADVASSGAELGVVVAYGAMIRRAALEATPYVNVHFSALPRWRGAAPVERAILAGDETTGVCVMQLEETLDTGPLYASRTTTIDDKSAEVLTNELAEMGATLLTDSLANWSELVPEPQSGAATYADKITPTDRELDPDRTANELARIVRIGRANADIDGRRIIVERAQAQHEHVAAGTVLTQGGRVVLGTRDGSLELDVLREAGRRAVTASEWINGLGARTALKWNRPHRVRP